MKKAPIWSHGILIVMLGIAVGLVGFVVAMAAGFEARSWALLGIGITIVAGGMILASRAKIDRSVPANEKRLPRAQLRRSPRR